MQDRCKKLISYINALNKTETEELFRIIHSKCQYTANNNGVFINLSWLDVSVIESIEQFIEFCSRSSLSLEQRENDCSRLSSSICNHVPEVNRIVNMGGNSMEMALAPVLAQGDDGAGAGAEAEEEAVSEEATTDESATAANAIVTITRRVSSSMRFYLLKKRFSKPAPAQQGIIQNLEHERYLIT